MSLWGREGKTHCLVQTTPKTSGQADCQPQTSQRLNAALLVIACFIYGSTFMALSACMQTRLHICHPSQSFGIYLQWLGRGLWPESNTRSHALCHPGPKSCRCAYRCWIEAGRRQTILTLKASVVDNAIRLNRNRPCCSRLNLGSRSPQCGVQAMDLSN